MSSVMSITVGSIYIDIGDKDVIEVTKVEKSRVFFKIIKDPNKIWGSDAPASVDTRTFLGWYTPMGGLAEAIYG